MDDLPIACTLLESERQKRRTEVLERVFARVQEARALDHGYALRFTADEKEFAEIVLLIQLERQCCGFLKFRLTVEPGGGPVWLEKTGPAGTKSFLKAAMGLDAGGMRADANRVGGDGDRADA